jgi:hypothetical protein
MKLKLTTHSILFLSLAIGFASLNAGADDLKFREVPGTGLDTILQQRRAELEKRTGGKLKGHAWWLWGLSAFDYDGDGDEDFIVCIHGSTNGLIIKNLQQETGQLKFADVTKELGVDGIIPSTDDYPLAWDFDGDGDLDIAGLLDDKPTPCLINEEGKKFTEAKFTLHPLNHPQGVRDLNGDGYLDVFQYRRGKRLSFQYNPATNTFQKTEAEIEHPFQLPKSVQDQIETLRGKKENRFIKFKYLTTADLNNDGLKDVIVSGFSSYSGDRVGWYLTSNGDGALEDSTDRLGLPREGAPFFTEDFDRDGYDDLLIASGNEAGFYRSERGKTFRRIEGELTDFLKRRCPYLHVAMRADFDNDGDFDLAISNRRYGQQRVFENKGQHFETRLSSRGWDADPLVIRDLNNDGRLDVIIGGAGTKENIGIFLNETGSTGAYCKIKPRMDGPNKFAVGTKLEIYKVGDLNRKDAKPIATETAPPNGSPIHIGLGTAKRFDMRVTFPGMKPQEDTNTEVKSELTIKPTN